ncbi:MAG: peptidyl-prolyl cis-trans isomerase [Candidatus Omnitrophota bacterium]
MKYIIITILVLMLSGCAGPSDKDVLARIDRKNTITLAGFNERISKLPKRYQDVINKNKKEFLDEIIIDTLLYNEAVRKKLDRDDDVKKVIREAEKKILIARLLNEEVEEKIIVNEKDISAYYDANKEKFATPEALRASHILVKTEEEAGDILVELSNNRNFEDLARGRSVDPTSKIGGDIGYFTRHQLVPEIEEICFNMQVGEISGIVKTKFGYHIIKLTERKPPRVKELAEVRDAIEETLKRVKKKVLFNEFVTALKEKAQITINNNLLETISREPEQKPED